MAIVLRIPKRQVRIAVVGLAVVALGAGVAAQTPQRDAQGALEQPVAAQLVPHDSAVTAALEPATPPAAQAAAEPQEGQQSPPAQQGDPPAEQEQSPQEAQQAPQTAPPPMTSQDLLTPEEREALQLVERLIQEQEGVLMGTGFDYDPAGRRDPFRSLLADVGAVSAPSVRPFGLPGFLISEVEVKAIAEVQGRWHAMVIGPNQRAYFLEVGTELFDGHVMQIGTGEVIFEQVVPDLTGARRTRQVIKRLRTTDGGGETP